MYTRTFTRLFLKNRATSTFSVRHVWQTNSIKHLNNRHILQSSVLKYSIIPASGISYWLWKTSTEAIYNDVLSLNPNGDTFEMSLYLTSREELYNKNEKERDIFIKKYQNVILRSLIKSWYLLADNIIEPLATIVRFFQLTSLFLPLVLVYPMTWLGNKVLINANDMKDPEFETTGSIYWFRLVRISLELAGPSFIKLGQWAGSRTDILCQAFCNELGKLHSNSRKHSSEYTKDQICNSLNENNFENIFEEFNDSPTGVGAIAQVHVGKIKENYIYKNTYLDEDNRKYLLQNKWLAVKVLHPNVRTIIKRDIKLMRFFANIINAIPTMEWLSLPDEVQQFEIFMNLQLDLRIESMNLSMFNKNFENFPNIKFPKSFTEITTNNVLFEEYIKAFPMEHFLKIKMKLMTLFYFSELAPLLWIHFLKMLIIDDFIHADLHPGNVLINFIKMDNNGTKVISNEEESYQIVHKLMRLYKDSRIDEAKKPEFISDMKYVLNEYTPQICFIDTGLVTELNSRNRVNFIALFNALVRFDGYEAGELMIERSRTPETAVDKEIFAMKVEKLIDKVKKRTFTLGTVSIGDLLQQMLNMVRHHHVRLEGDFVSIVVAILLLEGIGRQLDPDMDLFSSSLPILREYALRKESNTLIQDASRLSMLKIWMGLELRQLMNLSAAQIHYLLRTDQLSPNY
ncbi:hypothetical protein TBLA_0B04310 [Henningerozyma blattae CBS 6284]|uniref:ABC1 atypical kinase-like domain-containing protein n=1 Tax=Henningerozyma blattae (strain ATCC 34711 / CBS 6284 / DSM 70876 / NBRC 10599 / NRRL Y-10934 / UCD 77-7) TaxID=1071380 RepID=I2GYR6_HENB6|nr:hypothetical protein TBLA_0B04310 [Tetrapisispora blattae CBS 6284]CCH59268.1 hypothetical protein TBLA_0B04310 [Tetrapisispora blattae CBS 6284]